MKLRITVNGFAYDVEVEVEPDPIPVLPEAGTSTSRAFTPAPIHLRAPAELRDVLKAPIAGMVTQVLVVDGEAVAAGQTLLVLEAMKMESEITAPAAGTVHRIAIAQGDTVAGGQVLVEWA